MRSEKVRRRRRWPVTAVTSGLLIAAVLVYVLTGKPSDAKRAMAEARAAVTAKRDLNQRLAGGRTLLHKAALHGYTDVVEYLLGHGAKHDVPGPFDELPLHVASANGHEAVVRLLVERGASPDKATSFGLTPAYLAAARGHIGILTYLLAHEGKVDGAEETEAGSTPLHGAAREGHADVVALLIGSGASVDMVNDAGMTPLQLAAEQGHAEIVGLLVRSGAEVNARGRDGLAALSRALARRDLFYRPALPQHVLPRVADYDRIIELLEQYDAAF